MILRASAAAMIQRLHGRPAVASMVTANREQVALPPADADTPADEGFGGFEIFGRSGLDIGGLYRDQQWVGAWGGRC
jgi:hypothetical protein